MIQLLRSHTFPLDQAITRTVPFDQAIAAMADWEANPAAFTKIQVDLTLLHLEHLAGEISAE